MLMWEISSGQPPFSVYDHDYDLAMKIVNGMRPRVVPGTPLKYKKLMEQCWDADPKNRPTVYYLLNQLHDLQKWYFQNENNEQQINYNVQITTNSSSTNSSVNSSSKVHIFKDLPEPR